MAARRYVETRLIGVQCPVKTVFLEVVVAMTNVISSPDIFVSAEIHSILILATSHVDWVPIKVDSSNVKMATLNRVMVAQVTARLKMAINVVGLLGHVRRYVAMALIWGNISVMMVTQCQVTDATKIVR